MMKPRMLQICTSTQHTKHWKNSNAMGAWKLKLLSVALLSSTMLAEAAHSGEHQYVLLSSTESITVLCQLVIF